MYSRFITHVWSEWCQLWAWWSMFRIVMFVYEHNSILLNFQIFTRYFHISHKKMEVSRNFVDDILTNITVLKKGKKKSLIVFKRDTLYFWLNKGNWKKAENKWLVFYVKMVFIDVIYTSYKNLKIYFFNTTFSKRKI